ncbi:sulfatase-like hydrolase/transferase [Ensifer adhaerens]|uniref:sulfatase-like hydrolase/transferase n=1 Tax=Ensifer adhaerens TaxID=106592 RepID=UPI001CBC0193|nr:sulfatase-like hydrolase/transferase [Ensifer adhaerens]MBZ7923019.1 sulfatase-like hydrolase/transferase [Ensifer adhaerens]UAX91613.1 sulfatase-like hydrolase/transferase [Ensifer adhaerens]UAX99241.1 sulfatase-like hydrolase/transferase [Ensifer adhaerens]UAY06624.1 sulfatase-like hydrolase/transferase [Ensifer adhaerens]
MGSQAIAARAARSIPSLLNARAWRFALILGVAPNLAMLLVLPFYVAARPLSPLLYVFAGALALRTRPALAYFLFPLVAVVDLSFVAMAVFHLPFGTAIQSMRYMASLDLTSSAFYVVVLGFFVANGLAIAAVVNRNRQALQGAMVLPAILVAIGVASFERQINRPFLKQPAQSFESALTINGVTSAAVADGGRNMLFVMVEGLGALSDPAHAAILSQRLQPALDTGRYALSSGLSNFEGSTTGAESRELCGKWGDHRDYLDQVAYDCFPAAMADRGYRTISYHGFSQQMFERETWYPRIGFQETHFLESLVAADDRFRRRCGSVFAGLCDKDVADAVHDRLLKQPTERKFLYWLTLNSHIPYVRKQGGDLKCGSDAATIKNTQVCELTELWADVFDSVATIAKDPTLPPTDIFIVGDHTTPLWSRAAAGHFTPHKVQWYLLRDNRDVPVRG